MAGLDDVVIPPTHQPVGGGAVEEIMLAGTLPDKVPAVLRIDPDGTTAATVAHMESAGGRRRGPCLTVLHGVGIVARESRHEPDAVHASIIRVAKPVNTPTFVSGSHLKGSTNGGISEWVSRMGRGDPGCNFYKIVSLQFVQRLRERHGAGRQTAAPDKQDGDRRQRRDQQYQANSFGFLHNECKAIGVYRKRSSSWILVSVRLSRYFTMTGV